MPGKVFSFSKQLSIGIKAENLFIQCYHNLHPKKSITRDWDLIIDENKRIELKCESRALNETPNFAIERYSNIDTKAPGGIWQSYEKGSDLYIVCYLPDKFFYWFSTKFLYDFMNKTKHEYEKKFIKNIGWTGLILLVPRERLKHLVIRKDKF